MVLFNFCGLADKKFLILPLANAMSMLGDTLIVTEDTSYKYYITSENKISDVHVLIPDEKIDFTQHIKYDDGKDYQYIIYDVFDKLYDKANLTVTVRNKDRTFMPPIIMEKTDIHDDMPPEIEAKEVVLSIAIGPFEKKKAYAERGYNMPEKALVLPLQPGHFKWLQTVAETKEIVPFKDSKTMTTIVNIVEDKIRDVHGKSLAELITRAEGANSPKEVS